MRFENRYALTDLDNRTPVFFVREMFAHGDTTMAERAAEILHSGLGPPCHSVLLLHDVLRLLPEESQG